MVNYMNTTAQDMALSSKLPCIKHVHLLRKCPRLKCPPPSHRESVPAQRSSDIDENVHNLRTDGYSLLYFKLLNGHSCFQHDIVAQPAIMYVRRHPGDLPTTTTTSGISSYDWINGHTGVVRVSQLEVQQSRVFRNKLQYAHCQAQFFFAFLIFFVANLTCSTHCSTRTTPSPAASAARENVI